MRLLSAFLFALTLGTPLRAQPDAALQQRVEAILAQAPAGGRFGLLVSDMDGKPLVAIAPDERFMPASNTKIFTTIAAYASLSALDEAARGTGVRIEPAPGGAIDVILVGRGDARLSSAADCAIDCLAVLADAVAAQHRPVRHVIGDDSFFPDERWSPGMGWNNIQTRSGTGISALTLDDNELATQVTPAGIGEAPRVGGSSYYQIDNRALTIPGDASHLDYRREPNGLVLHLTGTIGAAAQPQRIRYGIDDPARYAAWRLHEMLEARNVKISGEILAQHRPLTPADDPTVRGGAPAAAPPPPPMLAELPALPLAEDILITNKQSQNLHAELLLRRLSRLNGSGSIADGEAALQAVMARAGVPRAGFDFADGSGMSTYNRVSPRAVVTLLGWAARQPWGAAWRESLPVGGKDGTLRRRFAGTALEGKLFAKTGSLNATSALSGYMIAASGRTLLFSILSNDMPDEATGNAIKAMDQALLVIAEGT